MFRIVKMFMGYWFHECSWIEKWVTWGPASFWRGCRQCLHGSLTQVNVPSRMKVFQWGSSGCNQMVKKKKKKKKKRFQKQHLLAVAAPRKLGGGGVPSPLPGSAHFKNQHNSGIPYTPYTFRVRIRVRIRVKVRVRVRVRIRVRIRVRD